MKIINGNRDQLRQQALAAAIQSICHGDEAAKTRLTELDGRLSRRATVRLVQAPEPDPNALKVPRP